MEQGIEGAAVTYKREGDDITLEMTAADFGQLLLIVGYAIGACSGRAEPMFYPWLRFVNELNTGNPHFTPYEIPADTAN